MEARPVKKQKVQPNACVLIISASMLLSFFALSFLTDNYNYFTASMLSVIIINLTVLAEEYRQHKKRAVKKHRST
ncbi:hypothetical protein [Halobacillus litoralis]|uniref:hypothetical protein n=1 Tax=Halobacillus litoralis TaxID=45668 RepID=UPI001CFD96F8|nr:hypothetical protein [Halobacillus litoralis]